MCPLPAGVRHLKVKPTLAGYANNASAGKNRRFNLSQALRVTAATPTLGSLHGGNEVFLRGVGFSSVRTENNVSFLEDENTTITVQHSNHTFISFISPGDLNGTGSTSASITVSGDPSENLSTNLVPSFAFHFGVQAHASAMSPTEGVMGDVLTISGSGFGAVQADVFFGKPEATYPCLIISWSDSQITCRVRELPAGLYQVRVRLPGGTYPGDVLPEQLFVSKLNVSGAETLHGRTAINTGYKISETTEEWYSLRGGFAGGTDLTLHGAGFGYGVSETIVEICGLPCQVFRSQYDQVTCRTPQIPTAEVHGLMGISSIDLHGPRGVTVTSEALSTSEDPATAFDDNHEDDIFMIENSSIGLDFEYGSAVVLTHVAIFPSPFLDNLAGTEFTAGNFTMPWKTVVMLPNGAPDSGWTIKALPRPVVAQRLRFRCGSPSRSVNATGCSIRGLRFRGYRLAMPPPLHNPSGQDVSLCQIKVAVAGPPQHAATTEVAAQAEMAEVAEVDGGALPCCFPGVVELPPRGAASFQIRVLPGSSSNIGLQLEGADTWRFARAQPVHDFS
jgi:hypothetical protein